MPVAVPTKSKGSSRWSALFGKSSNKSSPTTTSSPSESRPPHESLLHSIETDIKHATDHLPGEQDVMGAKTAEETDPIQRLTHFKVNVPQENHEEANKDAPRTDMHGLSDVKGKAVAAGEGSRAASLRKASDEDIQLATSGGAGGSAGNDDDDDEKEGVDDSLERIEFYRKDEPYYWLSNSSDHPVYLDGVKYPTAEHLFQSLKFIGHHPEIVSKIRKQSQPSDAIKESRKNITSVQKGWIGNRGNVAAMREVLLLKFSQHSALRRQLLLTGDSELVEASPTDAFWGIGSGSGFGSGRNELGKALVRTRETIRAQSGLGVGSGAKTI
ncbi:hypothetical protein CBS101457_006688 [Exobasidium rhododendri]|nr:hypothetical protein CBS101457_006688 [Exobasidium rhododendri]